MLDRLLRPIAPYLPENNRLERIWLLAKADYIARYYGSAFGVFWAFLNPLFQVLLYALVFTVLFRIAIPNYALYLFSGLIAWMFFSEATRSAMYVFRTKRYLIENVNMPKIDLFLASLGCAGMAFMVNFSMYLLISLFFPVTYSWLLLYAPLLIGLLALIAFGVGLMVGVCSLYFRDVQHLWDIVLMAGLWITPIVYGKQEMVHLPGLVYVNPLAGIFLNLRDVLVYDTPPDLYLVLYDAGYAAAVGLIAYGIFIRFSRRAAELI
jgi:ABC-type polysaccharide/polyol phosphate export permease